MAIPQIKQLTALSYKLFVHATNSQQVELGQVLSLDITESRDVNPNFVIGNDPPDVADSLIPGVVRTRTINLRRVTLLAKSLRQAFGRDDQSVVSSLSDQDTTIDLVATVQDPATKKIKTITFKDGFLSEVRGAITMEGDIRQIDSATYVYRDVSESEYQ